MLLQTMGSTADREFKCTYSGCNKSFSRRADLARHDLIHTNEKPFQCTIPGCKRGFNQRTALTVHVRTHTGEKPFICETEGCNRAFADKSTYARHQRVHTREKPYLCTIGQCYKRFTRRSVLIKHQQDCLHRKQTSPRRSPPRLFPTDGAPEPQSNLGGNTMMPIAPSSGNPNEVPALPTSFPFDTLCNTAPPGAFLADGSTIGSTGHWFTAASQPPLLGYEQACFPDWTLQNLSAAPTAPNVPGQNFFPALRPELRPGFMEGLVPFAAETYPERLEELSNHRWGQL